jgi:hypothetical protein
LESESGYNEDERDEYPCFSLLDEGDLPECKRGYIGGKDVSYLIVNKNVVPFILSGEVNACVDCVGEQGGEDHPHHVKSVTFRDQFARIEVEDTYVLVI